MLATQPGTLSFLGNENKEPTQVLSRRFKQKFTPDEDQVIVSMVKSGGARQWRLIAEHLDGRTARQCRERWVNYLSPAVTKSAWTAEEENLLREKVTELGKQWSRIAGFFNGRTDVSLKNRYLKLVRRDRMAERRIRKGAARDRTPERPCAVTTAVLSDDEGGAFWIDDGGDSGGLGWEFDLFDAGLTEVGEFPRSEGQEVNED
jgi:hypothetical protein